MRFLVLTLAAVLLLSACGSDPIAADAPGEQIYAARCASCHGGDLGGGVGPSLGAGSPSVGESRSYFENVIAQGRGTMPAFDGRLTDEQIEAVVDFILVRQSGS
jgi:mono/diheme cytochrome c family protein